MNHAYFQPARARLTRLGVLGFVLGLGLISALGAGSLSAQPPRSNLPPTERTLELLTRPEAADALENARLQRAQTLPAALSTPLQGSEPDDGLLALGAARTFHVYNFTTGLYEDVPATLQSQGATTQLWVADDQLGPTLITASTLSPLLQGLEVSTPSGSYDPTAGILALEEQLIGPRPNVDGSGKLNVLITDIQDGWNSGCGCAYTAGFFDPLDQDPTSPNSNGMDLLYVDAYPSLYTDSGAGDPAVVLNTLAHELQHLIHSGFGNLTLFQNEGQSEWAQQLCGYPARTITYLDEPGQTNVPLFAWRGGSNTRVDYQRASLFHAFLSGLVGEAALGPVTQSSSTAWAAYQPALGSTTRREALSRFHLTSWINDAEMGYAFGEAPQAGVHMRTPTLEIGGSGSLPRTQRAIEYGGAEFLRFTGVEDLTVTLETAPKVDFHIILTHPGGLLEVVPLQAGANVLLGVFEQAVLVVVGAEPEGNELSPTPVPYAFSATWSATNLAVETLSYADPATAYYTVTLPYGTETAGAVRFSSPFNGYFEELQLGLTTWLNGAPNPVGTGALRVSYTLSVQDLADPTAFIPGETLATLDIPLDQLVSGNNTIDLSTQGWWVENGIDFQLTFQIVNGSSDAAVSFDLDEGSTNTADTDYYPARTHRYFSDSGSWTGTWLNNGNLLVGLTLSGTVEDAPSAPVVPLSPIQDGTGYRVPLMAFWEEVTGATGYDLELAADAGFANLLFTPMGLLETWTELPGLEPGQSYYWRVRAVNSIGSGPWTEALRFSTAPPAEGSETLRYYTPGSVSWAATLPFNDETAAGIRISPSISGYINQFSLDLANALDGGSNPRGNSTLLVELHEAERLTAYSPEALYRPGMLVGSTVVQFDWLHPGLNTLNLGDYPWRVIPRDYFLVLKVQDTSGKSTITFNLDNGSTEPWNQDYYPARTFRYFMSTDSWESTWLNHGNLGVQVEVSEDPPETPGPEQSPTPPLTTPGPDETPIPFPTPTATVSPTQGPAETGTPTPAPTEESPNPTTPGDDTSGGCGCTQTSSETLPITGSAGLLLGLAGVLVGRRRVMLRRRTRHTSG